MGGRGWREGEEGMTAWNEVPSHWLVMCKLWSWRSNPGPPWYELRLTKVRLSTIKGLASQKKRPVHWLPVWQLLPWAWLYKNQVVWPPTNEIKPPSSLNLVLRPSFVCWNPKRFLFFGTWKLNASVSAPPWNNLIFLYYFSFIGQI